MKNLERFCDKDIEISLVSGNVITCRIIPETHNVDDYGEETVEVCAENGMNYKVHLNEVKMIDVYKK